MTEMQKFDDITLMHEIFVTNLKLREGNKVTQEALDLSDEITRRIDIYKNEILLETNPSRIEDIHYRNLQWEKYLRTLKKLIYGEVDMACFTSSDMTYLHKSIDKMYDFLYYLVDDKFKIITTTKNKDPLKSKTRCYNLDDEDCKMITNILSAKEEIKICQHRKDKAYEAYMIAQKELEDKAQQYHENFMNVRAKIVAKGNILE